jgi:hypothetical protein
MPEVYPVAVAYLDALPDALRAKASAHLRNGESNVAVTTLRMADPDTSSRLASEAIEVLAGRLGADMRCGKCFTLSARNRDDYPYGALCDQCSATTAIWQCPECDATIDGNSENLGGICMSCKARPDWEALPQAIRDEIGAMVEADRGIPSIYRLMELDGHRRPNSDYMRMVSYRMRLRRQTSSGCLSRES